MEFKDYYQVMGVARDATDAQIKQAYRKLARKYHPDVSKEPDAEARFKEVGEAYEVLRSPEKRAAYDRLGTGPRPGEDFRPPPDFGSGFEFSGASGMGGQGADYSDFFESLFGHARAGANRSRTRDFDAGRGEDHHAKIMLDLDASLAGGARAFTLRVPEIDAEGHLTMRERVLNVQVPKGILPGQTIRLAGQGAALHPAEGGKSGAGAAGDLYIEVEFLPHPLYRIVGRDLYLDLPVTPWEAALGATVKTPTPGGPVELKIPAGSHAGSKLRLKGRGMPSSPPGDLYAVLQIALPPASDDKAKAAYRAMAAAMPFNPRANLGE
ncbi:MAG TPA: DnaJ C-terminal domain-containing protein [Steroidobacteraceae bacterium]|nr:DnaJ C-terminal domain-containing protein [Steroidobacteraceae bacterium]